MIPKCRKQTDTHAHTVRAGLNPLPTGSEAVYSTYMLGAVRAGFNDNGG